ncbi:MAG: glycine cleavage system aminomethyltransferase GcvT [Chlamydiales bacterium]|nr:glycine cleavage system aminomethyltransferase GcvT [Chlamydiales bacterium]
MRTALYERHVALGAKIVDFAGWEMPISYKGIISEHMAVRKAVGIFDVSHMGRILVTGPEAESFLHFVSTNNVVGQADQTAIYTVLPNEDGGSIDDAIIYRESATKLFIIVNAANRQKDLEHLRKMARQYKVTLTPRYSEDGIIAIQGPTAEPLVRDLFPGTWQLKAMRFMPVMFGQTEVILARTGYTGSGGFEIIAPNDIIGEIWDAALSLGARYDLQPVGLGARDTLRLEAGFALYGHELADDIAATESISAWTVKWKKDFLGQEALVRLQQTNDRRMQHGALLDEEGVPRAGCTVFQGGREIGVVTSGSHSPCLGRGIAIVMVNSNLAIGEMIEIEVRGRRLRSEVVKLPFYKR